MEQSGGAVRTDEPYVLEDALNNNSSVHRLDLVISDPSQIQNLLVKFLPIIVNKIDRTGKNFIYLFIYLVINGKIIKIYFILFLFFTEQHFLFGVVCQFLLALSNLNI